METLTIAVLLLAAICLAESIVLLVLAARQAKAKKTEETGKTGEEDYFEKLWQEGLNGIMSYSIDNAKGKRREIE